MMLAMLAATALAGAGMMMGDIFLNAETVIKKDGRIVSYQLLVDTVRKNLYAGNNCTTALGAASAMRASNQLSLRDNLGNVSSAPIDVVNLAGALDPEATLPPFEKGVQVLGLPLKLDSTTLVLESGWKAKTGTSIKSMRIIIDQKVQLPSPYIGDRLVRFPANATDPMSATIDLKAGTAYLVIEPDHKGINVWAEENKKFWIKMYVYYNATDNTIHSCYDPTSEAVFCTETMRGVYVNDPALSADQRCRPDIGCFTYRNGVIPAGESCPTDPGSNYRSTLVGTANKLCTWCPTTAYALPTAVRLPGADMYQDLGDLSDLDCTSSNPYGGTSPREVWENYSYYSSLIGSLTPAEQAQYAGCTSYVPPCFDYPETCSNNCGGPATCNCPATDTPDDPGTCYDECNASNDVCEAEAAAAAAAGL